MATGVDLQGELADMRFEPSGEGKVSANADRLTARGAFSARRAYLGTPKTTVVLKREGGVSPSAYLIALNAPDETIIPQPFSAPLPTHGLIVAEAGRAGWDDVQEIANRTAGRTLVIEYPPAGEEGWTRYWMKGKGWPEGIPTERGLGVPGLVSGRRALALLIRPFEFDWRPRDVGRWGGANRWLDHGHAVSPGILFAWFGIAAFVLVWAFAQVMNEDRGPFVSELLVAVALSPAAIVFTGACARLGGLEAWAIVLPLALGGLYSVSAMMTLAIRRGVPEAHPLWAPCALGLACFAFCDPLWSDFSGRFGVMDLDVPGLAVGALLGYATGVAAFARGRWLGRTMVVVALLWGVTTHPWWIDGHSAFLILPALALVVAEGLFRPILFVALALLPTGIWRIVRDGIAWSPDGLVAFADQQGALNLWQSFLLLCSPLWIGSVVFVAVGLLVGNRFLAYRLRKLLRGDPRLRALPWAAAGVFALGLTEPLALPAAPVVAFGALIVLAYDGLRANA